MSHLFDRFRFADAPAVPAGVLRIGRIRNGWMQFSVALHGATVVRGSASAYRRQDSLGDFVRAGLAALGGRPLRRGPRAVWNDVQPAFFDAESHMHTWAFRADEPDGVQLVLFDNLYPYVLQDWEAAGFCESTYEAHYGSPDEPGSADDLERSALLALRFSKASAARWLYGLVDGWLRSGVWARYEREWGNPPPLAEMAELKNFLTEA